MTTSALVTKEISHERQNKRTEIQTHIFQKSFFTFVLLHYRISHTVANRAMSQWTYEDGVIFGS